MPIYKTLCRFFLHSDDLQINNSKGSSRYMTSFRDKSCNQFPLNHLIPRCSPEIAISSDLVTFRVMKGSVPSSLDNSDNWCYHWTLPTVVIFAFWATFFQAWKQDETCLPAMVRSMKAWYKLVSASIYWINGGAYPLAYWSRRSRMRLNCALLAKELSPNCQLNKILSSKLPFKDYSNTPAAAQ